LYKIEIFGNIVITFDDLKKKVLQTPNFKTGILDQSHAFRKVPGSTDLQLHLTVQGREEKINTDIYMH